MPRALLSVSDKAGIADLGRGLIARGFELVSTGGTARALAGAGLAVRSVSDLTGFPEMMDGRVKTLHPALHGGILARRDRPDDMAELERHGLGLVDLVVVNLYPFVKAAANSATPFDALIEEIDIGGPSLVRAAAKNFRGVLVVVDPADYPRLLAAIDESPSLAFRYELARKAIAHTAAYDTAITATLATIEVAGDRFERCGDAGALTARLDFSLDKIRDLRYGENPHQQAAWYCGPIKAAAAGLGQAAILQGKELSYTNLLDLDAAARLVLEFDEPAAAVIKHTNPCGAATGDSLSEAYLRARDILARKINMRVVTADFTPLRSGGVEVRSVLGAVLAQERDRVTEAHQPWTPSLLADGLRVATKRQPTAQEWEALRFAWRICAHVKSNTVVFTDARRTLAIGAGQMSRIDAVNVAVMKARAADRPLAGSVAASDAYFPFTDGLEAVAGAGATDVVQPGGSVRDAEVIDAADRHDLAMVFTGRRH